MSLKKLTKLFGPIVKESKASAESFRQLSSQLGPVAVCSRLCIGPNRLGVRHAIREQPKNPTDSGWMLASGSETDEYSKNPNNYVLVPLARMIETDASLGILPDQPVGSELTRKCVDEPWRWIVGDKVIDADGNLVSTLRR